MNQWSIPGSVESAFAHFTLVGLAAILDNETEQSARLRWTDELLPRAMVTHHLTVEDAASVVVRHAGRHVESPSWITAKIDSGRRAGSSLFTPRGGWPATAKAGTRAEWRAFGAERRGARELLHLDALDERLLAALGEPAWWRSGPTDERPDDGASRWEMKTRNRGEELLANRLAPLGRVVAARTSGDAAAGLTGSRARDELGKDARDSRTATGLTTPGPVDSVLAWCALWGLSATMTIAKNIGPPSASSTRGASGSSGVPVDGTTHPRQAALPVFTSPVTVGRWSSTLSSRRFHDWAFGSPQQDRIARAAAGAWLREQGVRAVLQLPIRKVGSASAPERQVLAGTLAVLP